MMGDHMLIIERYHEVCDEAIAKMQRKHGPLAQHVLDWIDGDLDRIRSYSAFLRGHHASDNMTEEQYQRVQPHNSARHCGAHGCTGDVLGSYVGWDWNDDNVRVCIKCGCAISELSYARYRATTLV